MPIKRLTNGFFDEMEAGMTPAQRKYFNEQVRDRHRQYKRKKREEKRRKLQERKTAARLRKQEIADRKAFSRNPALKPISKSTGWMKGPAGTQVKFKKNRGKTEVYIRRKPTAKRKTKKGKR